ncbi:putative quinol monooxygenase [Agrobacterium tumefaciens]|uniref:putative quinol monooxygenase n=1 Tax=Agrobacterium tumefaciens TaxID=358 RepID=UPI00287EF7A1|nr:putative quinol monooxygenase [Agrobacterium tumefaciens]MDS7593992.1 antibiotic biosynthesis monooxygenase [Agrobacterium tumefaciens]
MTKLTNIAFMRAKQGMVDELGGWLNRLAELSRSEPRCINYDVHRSLDEPDVWCVYENWRSKQDLDTHFETPHMREFVDAVPTMIHGVLDLHYLAMTTEQAYAPR